MVSAVRDGIFSFRVELIDRGIAIVKFDLIFFFFGEETKINFGKKCKRKMEKIKIKQMLFCDNFFFLINHSI